MWRQQAEQVAIIKSQVGEGNFERWWHAAQADSRVQISYSHAYALDRLHFLRRRLQLGLRYASERRLRVGSVRQLIAAVIASGKANDPSAGEMERYQYERSTTCVSCVPSLVWRIGTPRRR
jgi:hypothetical protein